MSGVELRWVADENFNNDILRALFRRNPALDIVRVQDAGLSGVDDPTLLAWAAEASRVLLTHDVSTVTAYAYNRVRVGDRMPGVFEVSRDVPILVAVDDILLIGECSHPGPLEWTRTGHIGHNTGRLSVANVPGIGVRDEIAADLVVGVFPLAFTDVL